MVSPEGAKEHKSGVIPDWLDGSLTHKGLASIEEAVRQGESRTAGEIVPLLVRASTVNASAPLLAVIVAGFAVLFVKHGLWLHEVWEFGHEWPWYLFFLVALVLGIAFGRSSVGQMWLTPRWEKRRQVQQRALLAFYQAGLNQTKGKTGILLFVSWRERQAIVLADEGIAKFYDGKTFENVVAELVRGAKEKDLASGYAKAVALSADILSKHVPLLPGDTNELGDGLRILDI